MVSTQKPYKFIGNLHCEHDLSTNTRNAKHVDYSVLSVHSYLGVVNKWFGIEHSGTSRLQLTHVICDIYVIKPDVPYFYTLPRGRLSQHFDVSIVSMIQSERMSCSYSYARRGS